MDNEAEKHIPRIDYDNLFHAYIVSGPEGSGKSRAAEEIAKAAVCSAPSGRPCGRCRHCRKAEGGIHPDIITVTREQDKKFIQIGQIRALRADAAVMPNEAGKKVYIISEADTMNAEAQNALLSVLEEPPAHVSFVLTAVNPGALLPTIRSRCVELPLRPAYAAPAGAYDEKAGELFALLESGEKIELLEFIYGFEKIDKNEMAAIAEAVRKAAADRLIGRKTTCLERERIVGIAELFGRVTQCLNANVSVGHIMGFILAGLI